MRNSPPLGVATRLYAPAAKESAPAYPRRSPSIRISAPDSCKEARKVSPSTIRLPSASVSTATDLPGSTASTTGMTAGAVPLRSTTKSTAPATTAIPAATLPQRTNLLRASNARTSRRKRRQPRSTSYAWCSAHCPSQYSSPQILSTSRRRPSPSAIHSSSTACSSSVSLPCFAL